MARPRDPDNDRAILLATMELLVEVGFGALTIEAIAERAGVSTRPTVYRRWATKTEAVVAAFQSDPISPRGSPSGEAAVAPDTASIRGDLLALVDRLVDGFGSMQQYGVMSGVLAEMAATPRFAEQIRSQWLDPDEQTLAVVFERAAERGEVLAGVDGPGILSLLAGHVLYRLVILGQPCPPEWRRWLVEVVLNGIVDSQEA